MISVPFSTKPTSNVFEAVLAMLEMQLQQMVEDNERHAYDVSTLTDSE